MFNVTAFLLTSLLNFALAPTALHCLSNRVLEAGFSALGTTLCVLAEARGVVPHPGVSAWGSPGRRGRIGRSVQGTQGRDQKVTNEAAVSTSAWFQGPRPRGARRPGPHSPAGAGGGRGGGTEAWSQLGLRETRRHPLPARSLPGGPLRGPGWA